MIDRFRSSTLGWLYGTLAGWGTCLLLLAGLIGTFWFLAQGTLQGAALLCPVLLVLGLAIIVWRWFGNLATT